MTLLGSLSTALATADRSLAALRYGGLGATVRGNSFLVSTPANQPVRLSGDDRLITYADSVATYPVVWGVWSKLLRTLASTDIGVFRDPGDGTKPKRVYGTSLEKVLRNPAPGKGLVDLLQWLFNPYLVEGNGLVAKFRGDGPGTTPTNFVPLDWRYLSALAVPGGPVEQWISYQIGEPRYLSPSEVVHLAWHGPDGASIGQSPLRALGTQIRLRDSADRFQVSSFDNGSRPAGAFVIPKDAKTTPEERAEWREQVELTHKGVDNAFRIAVLSGGVEWKQMSFSAVEAELIDTRNASDEAVCVAYDVRRSVIREPEGGGRAYQEVLRDFERTLRPHTRLAEQVLQRQLIDPEPEWSDQNLVVRFDLSDLRRGTHREEVESAVYGYTNGVTSEDEARDALGLEPSGNPGADKPRVPYAQLDPGDNRALPPSTETTPGRTTRPAPSPPAVRGVNGPSST